MNKFKAYEKLWAIYFHAPCSSASIYVGWDVFSVEPLQLIFDGSSDSLLTLDVVVSV